MCADCAGRKVGVGVRGQRRRRADAAAAAATGHRRSLRTNIDVVVRSRHTALHLLLALLGAVRAAERADDTARVWVGRQRKAAAAAASESCAHRRRRPMDAPSVHSPRVGKAWRCLDAAMLHRVRRVGGPMRVEDKER